MGDNPCHLYSDPTEPSGRPDASSQYSLVQPSLAPDKTSAQPHTTSRGLHVTLTSLSRKTDSDVPHVAWNSDIWPPCPFQSVYSVSRHLGTFACAWLWSVFISNFRTLPLPPLVANILPKPACDCHCCLHGTAAVMAQEWWSCPAVLALQLCSTIAVKSWTMWKSFN